MKKKLLLIPLALLLAISLVAIGCPAEEEPPPPPPPTDGEEPPPPPPPPEVIELTVNDHNPPFVAPARAMVVWAEWIEEQSDGRLKVTIIPGGALLKGDEVYRGVQTGIADAGHYAVDREDGFLLNVISQLPFMGWPAQHDTTQIYKDLLDEFPEMAAEWEGVKLIAACMMPGTHIHNNKKEVRTPEDLKGMNIHCAEAMPAEAVKAMGATASELDVAEMETSLITGLLDGVLNHFPVLRAFGAVEEVPYHTVFGEGGINFCPIMIIMSTDTLNNLPADLQQILVDSGQIWEERFTEWDAEDQVTTVGICEELEHNFIYLTPEEIAVWRDLAKASVHDEWIAECEAKGLPGQAVYEEALRLIQEYLTK